MSDAPRPSPWLPVNGDQEADAQDAPASASSETIAPEAIEPDADAPAQPATGAADEPTSPSPQDAWAPVRPVSVDASLAEGSSAVPIEPLRRAHMSPVRSPRVPRPVEVDEPEVIRPVQPPPANEILPTAATVTPFSQLATWSPGDPSPFDELDEPVDPVRALGESAAMTALLDAAGARTPASGIPIAPIADALPEFEVEEFVPRFATAPRRGPGAKPAADAEAEDREEGEPEPAAKPEMRGGRPVRRGLGPPVVKGIGPAPRRTVSDGAALAAVAASATAAGAASALGTASGASALGATPASAQASALDALAPVPKAPTSFTAWSDVAEELPPRAGEKALEADAVSDTPGSAQAETSPVTGTPAVPATPPSPPPSEPVPVTKGRRVPVWLWIVIGAVVAAGLGVGVYLLFLKPDPIILPAPVVTEEPPGPTIEAVTIEDDSPFLASMPTEISTFALTAYEIVPVLGDTSLPARAAEHVVLTYGEATGEARFTVDAYQFYTEDEAATAYAAWSGGSADRHAVTVAGQPVGERAIVTSGADKAVVWSNGTSVFILEGPADEVEQFYAYFGL